MVFCNGAGIYQLRPGGSGAGGEALSFSSSLRLDAWLDKYCLLPGQTWKSQIRKAIRNSTHFIALLSTHSVSKRGYVHKEVREALAVADELPENHIFIIPVRLENCEPSHDALHELNWIDLFPSFQPGFDRLLQVFGDEVDPLRRVRSHDDAQESQPGATYVAVDESLPEHPVSADPAVTELVNTDLADPGPIASGSQAMMLTSMEYDLELQIQFLLRHRSSLRQAMEGFASIQEAQGAGSPTHDLLGSRLEQMKGVMEALTFRIDGLRAQKQAIVHKKDQLEAD
jgi:hypothetical protein